MVLNRNHKTGCTFTVHGFLLLHKNVQVQYPAAESEAYYSLPTHGTTDYQVILTIIHHIHTLATKYLFSNFQQ